jgi:SAM-dependent methyltransferase
MSSAPDPHAREAYDAFAPYYDRFTASHDHATWTADLEALARSAGLRGRRLLDVACGSGKSFLPFLERGYEVTACDISPAMAGIAAEKAGHRARVEVHDMRALPLLGAFDLILCIDDAVNYLLEPDELTAALAGMRRNLAPSGVIVVDTNSLGTYRRFFAGLQVVADEDLVIVWRGESSAELPPGGRASATTQVLRRSADGEWAEATQRHRQRHHPVPVVREAARAAGLRIAAVEGMRLDGSFRRPFDELHCSKAVYVATAEGDQAQRPGTGTRGT